MPYGQESSFLKVLGETFPQMNPNVEAFKTDRRRLVPLQKRIVVKTMEDRDGVVELVAQQFVQGSMQVALEQ